MARNYTKGLARRCWDLNRYIQRYNLAQATGTAPGLDATQQAAVNSLVLPCQTLVFGTEAITFREQP